MNRDQEKAGSSETSAEAEFQRRGQLLLREALKIPVPDWDRARRKVFLAIIRFGLNTEIRQAISDIAETSGDPGSESMFVRHGHIDCLYRFGHRYNVGLQERVRHSLTGEDHFQLEQGTENHRIMNAAAGYLSAQTWPDWELAAEVKERCDKYLQRYFTRVTRYGQGEFDSTTYSVFYLTALGSLHDFAEDPLMRRRAAMMMDWYLANTAGDWLNGRFIGAHSRDYHPVSAQAAAPAGTTAAWLYFGGRTPNFVVGESHYSSILALSSYRAPDCIVKAARERIDCFEQWETHDVAHAEEPSHDGNGTITGEDGVVKGYGYISRAGVRRYNYVCPGYALGSMTDGKRGDIVWSGQLRRWSLDWDSVQPGSVFFFTHPFPDFGHEEEDYVGDWLGSSPYEQVVQHKGALVALYDIPAAQVYQYGPRNPFPSDRDPYIDGFLDRKALLLLQEEDGWLFAHGGTVLLAVRTLLPWGWTEVGGHERLRSYGLRNAVLLETASPDEYCALPSASGAGSGNEGDKQPTTADSAGLREAEGQEMIQRQLQGFRQAILSRTKIEADLEGEQPAVSFTDLSGNCLHIQYDGSRKINGEEIDCQQWELIENPWIISRLGSGIMEVCDYNRRLRWDFNQWTVDEIQEVRGSDEH